MKLAKYLKYPCFAATLLICPLALGQTRLGRAGQIAIGAERLTGLVSSKVETEDDDGDTRTDSSTNFHLLIHPIGTTAADGIPGEAIGGYAFPRIGVDYFVIDRLSIGAALGYFSVATTSEEETGGNSEDVGDVTLSGFLAGPARGLRVHVQRHDRDLAARRNHVHPLQFHGQG